MNVLAVPIQAEFALSFLRGIRITPGEPLRPESFRVVEKYRIITPSRGGFFHALVTPGGHRRCAWQMS